MSLPELQLHKRSTIKTYSRQSRPVLGDDDAPKPALKRRKTAIEVDDEVHGAEESAPVSPPYPPRTGFTMASSDASENEMCSSPPSSPARVPPPIFHTHRPTFSFLRRRHSPKVPPNQSAVVNSSILANITNTTDRQPPPAKKRMRFTQMQIDLGGDVRKTCKVCGMEYIPSNVDDITLHKRFHAMNVGGVNLGKSFTGRNRRVIWDSTTAEDSEDRAAVRLVVVIDRKSSVADKNRAKKVLEVVRRELSAVEIKDEDLWGQAANGNEKGDRFKVYLYIKGEKCVGLCLAERIAGAKKIIARASGGNKSSSVSVSDESFPAVLGISRIWTSQSCRRQGVARKLLECAASTFIYGMNVPKTLMAFSQPTESGGELADRWFEGIKDWGVLSGGGVVILLRIRSPLGVRCAVLGGAHLCTFMAEAYADLRWIDHSLQTTDNFAPSNPFRRSVQSRGDTDSKDTRKTDAVRVVSFLDSTPRPAGKGGTLSVEDPTPPQVNSKNDGLSSPQTAPAHEGGLSISPKPHQALTLDSAEASPTDPFDSAPEEDGEEVEELSEDINEDQLVASATPHEPSETIPPNPFRKVSDGADGGGRRRPPDYNKAAQHPLLGEASRIGPHRTSLDVDAFKRLMLTGNATGSAAASSDPNLASPQFPQASPAADCGNSTDTSSISRQSIFEPTLDAQLDTPRTSHEISASDEERQRLVHDGSLSNPERKKPPPPRTRHGKLIKDNHYLPSSSSLSLPSLVPTDVEAAPLKPFTDLNKPLPPPPLVTTPESEIEDYGDAVDLEAAAETSKVLQAHLNVTQRKAPPSPPVTRRWSQRSKLSRDNATEESLLRNEATPGGPLLDGFSAMPPSSSKAPPPPPLRRSLSIRSSSNVPTVSAIPPTPPATANPTDPLSPPKPHSAAPPPPPTRSPSISSAKRPPRRSPMLGGPITSSPLLTSTVMPPPPPPPRQRGSSRSSFDNPLSSLSPGQTGGDFWSSSGENMRRESGASLGQAPSAIGGSEEFGAKDLLADLSALQKEVDELRGKYEKRASSQGGFGD
ncbi:MAG: N-acetyltransferase O1 (Establishment of cohesion protein 1) [Geoglossum umbratile]|nr:MAG: N-acetyltransferase O1 (Establishment of cohesion protein 1) [Geoglossum umbratile]